MRLKLDENLPSSLLADLARIGDDADTCTDEGINGKADDLVAASAASERRILLTLDTDFADIRRFPPGTHPGIIVLRLETQDAASCRSAIQRAFAVLSDEDVQLNLVIIEDSRVRIRRAVDN